MSIADPCRRALTPTEEARLFARDALKAARERMTAYADNDAGSAMLAVFSLLAVEALFPDLVTQPPGDVHPHG